MATEMLQYLDPDGLDETVLNIGQIKTSLEGQISDLGDSIEEEMQNLPYARPDGIYPDMTVGAVIGADSTAQWAQRTTEGSGSATVRSVQGAAVAWNQMLAPRVGTVTQNGVTFVVSADGSITANGTAEGSMATSLVSVSVRSGHKYLFKGCPQGGATDTYGVLLTGNSSVIPANNWDYGAGNMVTAASDGDAIMIAARIAVGYTAGNLVFCPQLFDLTQMFGSGNEPTTVAEFERMYPAAYYPYSAPTLKPVKIAGIASTDAQGGELDGVEWTAQTLRAAGSVRDELTADELVTRVGVVDLGTLTWALSSDEPTRFYTGIPSGAMPYNPYTLANIRCALFDTTTYGQIVSPNAVIDNAIGMSTSNVAVRCSSYATAADFKTAMSGVLLFYELATPTTTPISPALPMTYRVEQGGMESIVVPEGEVSAAPVLTIAEPINAGDEFARIWEAIQSLGYTRNVAQLSQPISLTDIGSIDEVQKDTAEIAEKDVTEVVDIDTTKEVQE